MVYSFGGDTMFKKQKEKLKSQYNAKKYELKQAARQKIADSVPDPVKAAIDYKEQRDVSKATHYKQFDVAGCFAHQSELQSLGTLNPKFGADVPGTQYKYRTFKHSPVSLEFEPTNEHDPHAIMVKIDHVFIGYVPRDENIEIGKMLIDGKAKQITARIYGGDYSYMMHGNTYIEPNDIECQCRIYYK